MGFQNRQVFSSRFALSADEGVRAPRTGKALFTRQPHSTNPTSKKFVHRPNLHV